MVVPAPPIVLKDEDGHTVQITSYRRYLAPHLDIRTLAKDRPLGRLNKKGDRALSLVHSINLHMIVPEHLHTTDVLPKYDLSAISRLRHIFTRMRFRFPTQELAVHSDNTGNQPNQTAHVLKVAGADCQLCTQLAPPVRSFRANVRVD